MRIDNARNLLGFERTSSNNRKTQIDLKEKGFHMDLDLRK